MASAVGGFGEHKSIDSCNIRPILRCINQITTNWNESYQPRVFSATSRKEGRLQAWIEVAYFSLYPYNWMRIKAPDNAWQRAWDNVWQRARQLHNVLTTNRNSKRQSTQSFLSSTCSEIFVCVLLKENGRLEFIFYISTGNHRNNLDNQIISLERFISSRRDESELTGNIFNLSAVKLKHVCWIHFLVYLRFASLTFAWKLSANTTFTWKYGRYSNFLQLL